MTIECTNYKPINRGTLLGYADFYLVKTGLEIYGCSVHQKDGRRWVNFPSREYKNSEGETKYSYIVRFKDPEHMKAFTRMALDAVEKKAAQPVQLRPVEIQDDLPF